MCRILIANYTQEPGLLSVVNTAIIEEDNSTFIITGTARAPFPEEPGYLVVSFNGRRFFL